MKGGEGRPRLSPFTLWAPRGATGSGARRRHWEGDQQGAPGPRRAGAEAGSGGRPACRGDADAAARAAPGVETAATAAWRRRGVRHGRGVGGDTADRNGESREGGGVRAREGGWRWGEERRPARLAAPPGSDGRRPQAGFSPGRRAQAGARGRPSGGASRSGNEKTGTPPARLGRGRKTQRHATGKRRAAAAQPARLHHPPGHSRLGGAQPRGQVAGAHTGSKAPPHTDGQSKEHLEQPLERALDLPLPHNIRPSGQW